MKKVVMYALGLLLLTFLLCACDLSSKMTDEEWAMYRASLVHEYEVCSVMQYVKVRTNNFGGVKSSDLCYAFTYIDGNGNLKTIDDFQHYEYGLTKVCVGDTNKYVVDTYGETIQYLYLTRDTLQSISGSF